MLSDRATMPISMELFSRRLRAVMISLLWAAALLSGPACPQPNDAPTASSAVAAKVALVLGNGAYEQAALRNPVADARAMADSLKRLGFRVTLRTDATLPQMVDAMEQFAREGRNDDVRLFFYAGHGLQFRGKNYLVPVDAHIGSQE